MAMPLMTTFGGVCCSPSAFRNKFRTTTILANEVTMTAMMGATARETTVRMISAGEKFPSRTTGCQRKDARANTLKAPVSTPTAVPFARTVTLVPANKAGEQDHAGLNTG